MSRTAKWVIVGVIAFLVLAPLAAMAMIWSINTLFHLGIPYTIKTVMAMLLLSMLLGSSGASKKAVR